MFPKFLPEVQQVLFRQASLHVRTRIVAGRRVTLEINEVGRPAALSPEKWLYPTS